VVTAGGIVRLAASAVRASVQVVSQPEPRTWPGHLVRWQTGAPAADPVGAHPGLTLARAAPSRAIPYA